VPARQPGDRLETLGDLALAAIPVHLEKERLVADAAGVLVHARRLDVGAERIRECELILDVGIIEELIEALAGAAVGHRRPGAILPDQLIVVVAGEKIRIGGNKRVERRIGGCPRQARRHQDECPDRGAPPHRSSTVSPTAISPAVTTSQ
jgi:hypothetical protein